MPRGRPRKNADDVLVRSAELIGWALGGIEREIAETRERLGALTARAAQLRRQSEGRGPSEGRGGQAVQAAGAEEKAGGSRRRRMSAEGRKRIADAAWRRWAKWRAEHKNR